MKILWLAEVEPNPDSGAAGTEYHTVAALREAGCGVECCWKGDFPRRIAHHNLHYCLESPRVLLSAAKLRFRSGAYDAVVFNQPHGFLLARWLRRHFPAIPSVHKSHGLESLREDVMRRWGGEPVGGRRGLLRRVASAMLGKALRRHMVLTARVATGHIVSSTACASHLVEAMGVPRDRVAVVPQAVPEGWTLRAGTPPEWPDGREKRLLYVGQFALVKGYPVLLRAWEQLCKETADVGLTWVTGAAEVGRVLNMLPPETRARTSVLPWRSQSDLLRLYDSHGVFVWPSYFEGFGKAFLEAMARGLCVVSTMQGGAADLLRDGSNGLLVPVGDADALSMALRRAVREPGLARKLGCRAAEDVRGFTWSFVAGQIVQHLEIWRKKISRSTVL